MAAMTLPCFFASLAGTFVGSSLQAMNTGLKTRGTEQAIKTGTMTKRAKTAVAMNNVSLKKAIKKHNKGKKQSSVKIDPLFDEDYLGMRLAELAGDIEVIQKTLSRVCARVDTVP